MQIFIRPSSIKVISFDLDDTLYDNRPAIINAEAELLAHMHSHHPESLKWQRQDWRKLKLAVLKANPALAHDPSIARTQVLTEGLKLLGYKSNSAEEAAKNAFDCFYHHRSNFTVPAEVLSLLTNLSSKYHLIGITNGNVDAQRIGLGSSLEFVLNAGQGLRMKPYADMFNHASERLQIVPSQILHVGDSLSSDVAGARSAGYQAAWLSPSYGRDKLGGDVMSTLPQIRLEHINELNQLL